MDTNDVVGANLKTLRKVRRLTQAEFAERTGVSRRTIARLEAGKVADPTIGQMRALARALGVTVDLLIETALVPITIAVPESVRQVLETPEGMELLSELAEYERMRGRQTLVTAIRAILAEGPRVDRRTTT